MMSSQDPKERRKLRIELLKRSRSAAASIKPEVNLPQQQSPSFSEFVAHSSVTTNPQHLTKLEKKLLSEDAKRELRRIRNRESALLSRKRKNDEIEQLADRVESLEAEVMRLRKRLMAYEPVEMFDKNLPGFSKSSDEFNEKLSAEKATKDPSKTTTASSESAVLYL